MKLAVTIADEQVAHLAARLDGGSTTVFDATGRALATCRFADIAFPAPARGRALAYPLHAGIAIADGVPDHYQAYAADGGLVGEGPAGHVADEPPPEMQFKVRQIIKGADVIIETFEIHLPNLIEETP